MATAYLDPNGNVNTAWSDYNYTQIDDAVRQPSAPSADDIWADEFDSGIQTYNMNSFTLGLNIVTSIKMWVYIDIDGGSTSDPQGDISLSGCDFKSFGAGTSFAWKSVEWTTANFGLINQTDIDGIQASIYHGIQLLSGEKVYVRAMYLEITYASSGSGIYLDPNANVNGLWNVNVYTNIDDAIRSPTVPSSDHAYAVGTDDNENQTYHMTTVTIDGYKVTTITLYAFGQIINGGDGNPDSPYADINISGCNEKDLTVGTSNAWHSVSWTGLAITAQATIDGIQASLNSKAIPSKGGISIDAMYLDLTVERLPSGPQNLDEWDGIAWSDLEEWNGVAVSDLDQWLDA